MITHLVPVVFSISEVFDIERITENPDISFSFEAQPQKKEPLHLYDTFDWRAWNKNTAIILSRNQLNLIDIDNGKKVSSVGFRRTPQSFFPEEIPDDKTRSSLQAFSKPRAFLRYGTVSTLSQSMRVLDRNMKTVATIEIRSILPSFAQEQEQKRFITLTPVKGFHKEFEKLTRHILTTPSYAEKSTYRNFFIALLDAISCEPGINASKAPVKLHPDNTILDSARELLLSTLAVIHANETWIPKNIDTEFLHDYRVAIRRTRSILARLQGILPPEELLTYKQAFRELGRRTNDLRDQDVYLLEADRFRELLPPAMRNSLNLFFTDLRNRHKKELRSFSRHIASEKHKRFLQEWESFLRSDPPSDPDRTPEARRITSDVAVASIRKAWKKVLRHGRTTSPEATDTELHALRLDCKKLRYLLEFYSSLFPRKTLRQVVRQLKNLQDNLGLFVDLSVQQDYLTTYLSSLERGEEVLPLAASIGGLVTALHHKREAVRKEFHHRFEKFDRTETETMFNELFKPYRQP
ncbi:MAG: CHAD domain-containing protein [Chlorobium phaeobacteroides]|uniref:CHAD domain containing protein n=1 Tax=Chlorobium phaeobacteroides (strain BS1) TaxID=331678 RepID=B3EJ31_CHLPB|nr:CHAD domain-containing protein [Chlorobium phaeobacteroides]